MKQTIDISPDKVGPIAVAASRFLNLETTLIPGNVKNQLAVLEVFLAGLASGELILATPTPPAVESDVKSDGADEDSDKESGEGSDGPKTRPPTPEELDSVRQSLGGPTGAGDKESG